MSKCKKSLVDRLRSISTESPEVFLVKLSEFNKDLEFVGNGEILSYLTAPDLYKILSEMIDSAIIEKFRDREQMHFTKEDFKGTPQKSEQILECLHILLKHTQDCSTNEEITSNIKKIGPKLLYFVTGNIPKNVWTSSNSIKNSKLVLQELRRFFRAETSSELVQINVSPNSSDLPSPESTLYGKYHTLVKHKLTKEKWQNNPFAKASFTWLLLHVKFPHLSDNLNAVLPLPLNMVDDFNIENKILGVQCLHHIMNNVSHEELRWYGRAEVVYEALKHQLYTKDATLVEILHPALLSILNIVEKMDTIKETRDVNRCDEVFRTIVFDCEMENNLAMRRALTANLPNFIDMIGIAVVRHMRNVVSVVCNYLEVYDGPDEISRINALNILKTLLVTAWPRVPAHAGRIVKCLLKFLYDIGTDKTITPQSVKDEVTDLAAGCLVLLKMAAPDIVQPALLGITETDTLDFVKNVVVDVCNKESLTAH